MKSKKEIKKWLLENAVDAQGRINLKGIDFGEKIIVMDAVKAKAIFNNNQKADDIFNDNQKAHNISNDFQEAYRIYNNGQEASYINNNSQKIKPDYESMTKEELIKELKRK